MKFPINFMPLDSLQHDLAEIVQIRLAQAKPSSKPVFLHMLGVPGAGKSTLLEELIKLDGPKQAEIVSFDALMEASPFYNKHPNNVLAFSKNELPAREAGYCLLNGLMDIGANIIFDHGGSFSEHVDLLQFAREEKGYRTVMAYLQTSSDVALQRLQRRKRYTPPNYVIERAERIKMLLPTYRDQTDVFMEFQNDHEGPTMEHMAEWAEKLAKVWQS